MAMASGIASGLGAAVNAGGAISSGIKGNKASQALNQAQTAQDGIYSGMMGAGQDALDLVMRGYGNLQAGQGPAAQFTAPGFDQYDFQNPTMLADQGVQNAISAGDTARLNAREQVSMQSQQLQSGLGGALADRGFGPQSGAAVAALGQNAMAANQGLMGLERDIMGATQQAAFQGAQMDNANLMQMAGLGSQYNMGMNQLRQQSALGGFQANLASQNQQFGQQYNLLQGQQGLASGLMQGAMGGMEAGLDRRTEGAKLAGAGKGAATSGAVGNLGDLGNTLSGKQPAGLGGDKYAGRRHS